MDARQLKQHCDIGIIGGSLAGLAFARLLQAQLPQCTISVLDDTQNAPAGKTLIIERAAADCLQQFAALPANSKAIQQVRISLAGIQRNIGRNVEGQQPLGYSISQPLVQLALKKDLPLHNARVAALHPTAEGVTIHTNDNSTLHARYLVIACPLPLLPPPFRSRRLAYQQSIFSLQANSDLPLHTAYQYFSYRKVMVLVPRAEDDATGVILCVPHATSGDINALSDSALSTYLSDKFKLSINVSGKRFAYHPQLLRTTPLASDNIALIGSGASTLHPIGAQAISLGIADAQVLAKLFIQHTGTPPQAALQQYHRQRVFAHRRKALLTSTLALGAFGAGGLL